MDRCVRPRRLSSCERVRVRTFGTKRLKIPAQLWGRGIVLSLQDIRVRNAGSNASKALTVNVWKWIEATVSVVIDASNLRPADTLGFDNGIEAYSDRVLRRLIASCEPRLFVFLVRIRVYVAIGWEISDVIHVHVTQTMVTYHSGLLVARQAAYLKYKLLIYNRYEHG